MRLNEGYFIVGPPEFGKTSVLAQLYRRHMATKSNPIALIHDPEMQFTRDAVYPTAWVADAAAYRRLAAEHGKSGKPMPRSVSMEGSSEEVSKLAMELGDKAGNSQWDARLQIFTALDEQSDNDHSGAHHTGKADLRMICKRRHKGIVFAFNMQDPTMMEPKPMRMGTSYFLFAQTRGHSELLDERLFLEKGTLYRSGVCRLEPHQYLHVKQRVGVVREPL